MKEVQAHFFDENEGKVIFKKILFQVPRVGDEIRIFDAKIYQVTKVVWIYDETDFPLGRVNLGVIRATNES